MSRLIVKNLPHGLKEEKLRNHFGKFGGITDCSLKYTRDGQFRRFAFVGFKTTEEAEAALAECHNTYISTSKIQVELAKDLGDTSKPRAWSKYSNESSVGKTDEKPKSSKDKDAKTKDKKKKSKKNPDNAVVNELLGELKDDPKFQEFLDSHQNVSVKPVWTNDAIQSDKGENLVQPAVSKGESDLPFDDDTDEESLDDETAGRQRTEEQEDMEDDDDDEEEEEKVAAKPGLSDLDYLRSKTADQKLLSDSESDSDSGDEGSADEESDSSGESPKKGPKSKKGAESKKELDGKKGPDGKKGSDSKKGSKEGPAAPEEGEEKAPLAVHMLDLKGLPSNCGEKAVREFFTPLEVVRLKVPKNAKKKPLGIAHVGFKTEGDLEQALRRNKNFIGGKRVYLRKAKFEQTADNVVEKPPRPWELKQQQGDQTEEADGIAETGRLFVRNLPYSSTEDDLEAEFKPFGPLTEVNLPIDSLTKKVKGFGFITYMMPEHALKAYTEMDGKVFQGRMMHILPAKEKKEETDKSSEKSSYKKQKEKKQKALAGSSHNWNSLFLGANAVADVLAEKYKASKRDILDTDMRGSLGVRMALGETQIVSETRDFLLENGVALDSFSQPTAARSKTVILVKNLPAKTPVGEIGALFAQHGTLGRVLLPPSGITALVEFPAPTEARAAFTKLAYTKFQHVPLYLEWAPMGVFTTPTPAPTPAPDQGQTPEGEAGITDNAYIDRKGGTGNQETKETEEGSQAVGSTLFVKNLNFNTTDEQLGELFEPCGKIRSATVAKKKDVKNPGTHLSMGYGFVEFATTSGAETAVKQLQYALLDGHRVELKISHRATTSEKKVVSGHKRQAEREQTTTKILVRNIPFEAKREEIEELFKVFGELKSVRLPKKMSGTGSHRGFAFVDFLTKPDAKRAFEALCHSTHLFGRRLVLEWAKAEDDIDDIRKRTTEHFSEEGGKKKFTKANLKESLEMSMDL